MKALRNKVSSHLAFLARVLLYPGVKLVDLVLHSLLYIRVPTLGLRDKFNDSCTILCVAWKSTDGCVLQTAKCGRHAQSRSHM